MKAALISLESVSSKMTLEAMDQYFDSVDSLNIKKMDVSLGIGEQRVYFNDRRVGNYDCIYAKGSFRYAPLLRSVTSALSSSSYMPIKADSFTIGHDKLLTHLALQLHKIPMPVTYLASSPNGAKGILKKINYPIIMKFPHGTGGKGVLYADSFASASSMLDALVTLRQPFLIQEYVETGGIDIRALVIGDRVVAAMKRKAELREKRANIHTGGKGEGFTPDSKITKMAINTARSIGADICAVDMLESVKGPVVIEANLSPGLQGITASTGVNVADKIAKFLYEKTKEFIDRKKGKDTSKIFTDLGISTENKRSQEIISNLDIRSDRIVLPKVVSDITGFNEQDEVILRVKRGRLVVERFS